MFITEQKQPLKPGDMRALAGALLIAADGLAHGDQPEQVRARIEQGQPLMQTIEVSEHDRIVILNGVVFRLHCTWQTGSWGWMTQRPGQPIRISGAADTLDGGFARALEIALNWEGHISATLGAPAPDEESIDPAAPEYQSTRLGIVEPAIDLEGDTQPIEPVAAPDEDWDEFLSRRSRELNAHLDELEDERETTKFIADNGYHPDDHYPGRNRVNDDDSDDAEAATVDDIPADVIEALIVVRDSAVTNMLDRARVMTAMEDAGYLGSAVWVDENPNRYMDALNKMGRVTSRRDEPRDDFPGFPGTYF